MSWSNAIHTATAPGEFLLDNVLFQLEHHKWQIGLACEVVKETSWKIEFIEQRVNAIL